MKTMMILSCFNPRYRLCSLLAVSIFLPACADSPSKKTLAPVYKGYTNPYHKGSVNNQQYPQQVAPKTRHRSKQPDSAQATTSPRNPHSLASIDRKLTNSVALMPAVSALIKDADKKTRVGNLEGAVFSLERALRIDSRSAWVTYKLAQLRAKQSKFDLAENLSKQAALLAGNDAYIKKLCWLLIARAREGLQNTSGARAARLKAADFL